ncbi:MAG: hypothetical protein OES20_10550 [Gammaproteobacteria bacterium]|nr:hypothetical protein [Gammaproteobacteria bacterium]MDH3859097.1 hypothetical protein [Gammaproteobacteria bacterium]
MNESAQIIMYGSFSEKTWLREKAISAYGPADQLATTHYELATGIGRHVPRLEGATNGT